MDGEILGTAIACLSPKTLRRELEQSYLQFRFALSDEVSNEFAGDRAEAEAKHGMAGGDGSVLYAGDRADARKAIGRART